MSRSSRSWFLGSLVICLIATCFLISVDEYASREMDCVVIPEYEYLELSDPPQSASDGQFIDKILIFEAPSTEYEFEFNFIKNHRYEFFLQLYMPDVDLNIHAVLNGMDADEDTIEDVYELAEGSLIDEDEHSKKGGFTFTCPQTGAYNLTLTGATSENTNVFFSARDDGIGNNGEIIYDTMGYHNDQERQYYFELADDTLYSIKIARVTSLSTQHVYSLPVSHDLYDYEGRVYHLIKNQPIGSLDDTTNTVKEFGTALKGQYRFEPHVITDIPVTDLLFTLKYERAIGDGPEIVDPSDIDENKDPLQISVDTVVGFIPLGIGIVCGVVAFLAFFGKKSKSHTPRIA